MSGNTTRTRYEVAANANARDLLVFFDRRLSHGVDAADALSDTLLAAWRRRSKLPADPVEARMWLFGIARNVLLNAHRGERRRTAALERLCQEAELARIPRQHGEAEDLSELVREAITSLPTLQAELIRLTHWEGFTLVEVAKILGIPSSTARSRYAAARSSLREYLSTVLVDAPVES